VVAGEIVNPPCTD